MPALVAAAAAARAPQPDHRPRCTCCPSHCTATENACYSALNFAKGIRATFFNPATSAAIKERMSGGKDADLKSVMKVRAGQWHRRVSAARVRSARGASACLHSPAPLGSHTLPTHARRRPTSR